MGVQRTKDGLITIKPAEDWIEKYYGSMNDHWKGRDLIKELEKMRNEW